MGEKCDFQEPLVVLHHSMYKYYQLTLFLVLIGKFDQKLNFQPRLAWIRSYKSRMGLNEEKTCFLRTIRDIT